MRPRSLPHQPGSTTIEPTVEGSLGQRSLAQAGPFLPEQLKPPGVPVARRSSRHSS